MNLVFSGEFPPISRFRAKNALFRTFRGNPCTRTRTGRGRGARSLNKQNPECALPTPGPGARAGGPEQRTGGPERAFPKPVCLGRRPSVPSDSQDAGHTLGCDRNYDIPLDVLLILANIPT